MMLMSDYKMVQIQNKRNVDTSASSIEIPVKYTTFNISLIVNTDSIRIFVSIESQRTALFELILSNQVYDLTKG